MKKELRKIKEKAKKRLENNISPFNTKVNATKEINETLIDFIDDICTYLEQTNENTI
jgi:hypothetical protein